MLDKPTKIIITTAARAAGVLSAVIIQMLSLANGESFRPRERRTLLSQAQKAYQLGVSRFTITKLTRLGKLHPMELLPGLFRYRAEELV